MIRLSFKSGTLLASVVFAVPSLAYAQSQDDVAPQGTDTLAEIIVTAQKREQSIQDVPLAVTAISAESLNRTNADSITALQGVVPGMIITRQAASPATPALAIRGIGYQEVEKSVESGVGFVLDGVPLATSTGTLLDAFDVERIEVLRGPQGLLFGRNTTGGTINVVRSRPNPNDPATGKFRFTVGSFGRNDYEGVVSAPVIPGKLAAKVAIAVKKDNGAFKNRVFGGRNGDRDMRDYIVTLNATPTDNFRALLTLERLEDDSEIQPSVNVYVPNTIALDLPGYFVGRNIGCTNPFLAASCLPFDRKRNSLEVQSPKPAFLNISAATLEMAYDADSLTLTSISAVRKSRESQLADFDYTQFALFRSVRPQEFNQFSQELRMNTSFDGPFNFTAGAFYFDYDYSVQGRNSLDLAGISPIMPGQSFLNSLSSYDTKMWTKSYALFFQGEYRVTDRLKIIFGGRQTWDRKKVDFTSYGAVPSTVRDLVVLGPVTSRGVRDAKFKKFTPKLAAEYSLTDDVMAYASYSRGYNAGGFNGRPATATFLGPFNSETMDAYEIGLKTELFDRRVRFNLAAFHNTMKDKQESSLVFIGTSQSTTTLNAAKARYKGIEGELTVIPMSGWTIQSSAGYLNAKYLDFFANLGQGLVDASDLKLSRAPKWTASAISDYKFQAGPGQIGLNAAIYYTDSFWVNRLNDPRGLVPDITKIDLAARYEFPVASLEMIASFFVKNVTDNTTFTNLSSGNAAGTFIDVVPAAIGRTWGSSLMVKF